ncbi:hypothetical protein [Stenotrophomonas sp. SPM]|uniref:hypothetical protein n=1 Tax=Stenotrophomonas sp. SPM TaxID=2170735 RepID=UPI001057B54B|nr:hypothetical protein [Stenotrophomonas sp. SPM]
MEGIVNRLMELQGGQLLTPLAMFAVLVLIFKALSGLQQTRGSARREFLELFQDVEKKDDLWLSVAVRHHFGVYLPVSIIRRLCKLDQPARAIMEVADAWPLVDTDDLTGEIRWRSKRHANPATRRRFAFAFLVGYFASALCASLLAYILVVGQMSARASFFYWIWVVLGGVAALYCVHRSDLLRTGGPSLERWLGVK